MTCTLAVFVPELRPMMGTGYMRRVHLSDDPFDWLSLGDNPETVVIQNNLMRMSIRAVGLSMPLIVFRVLDRWGPALGPFADFRSFIFTYPPL